MAGWSSWVRGFVIFTYTLALQVHSCAKSEQWKVCSICQNTLNVKRRAAIFGALWAFQTAQVNPGHFSLFVKNIPHKSLGKCRCIFFTLPKWQWLHLGAIFFSLPKYYQLHLPPLYMYIFLITLLDAWLLSCCCLTSQIPIYIDNFFRAGLRHKQLLGAPHQQGAYKSTWNFT